MGSLISGARRLGLELAPEQLKQFDGYYQELLAWNQRINLTSVTSFEGVQINHFLDSLTITTAGQQLSGTYIIDVGAGAGLPGLPLKILFPEIKLVLLEAKAKKADFLNCLKERLGLADVEVVVGRAEEVAHEKQYREQFDIALSRAVAPLPTLVELVLPFLRIGGRFIAQKKGAIDLELSKAARAIELMGGEIVEVKGVRLAEFDDRRYLIIIEKMVSTPCQYPRRPGMPAKRPIHQLDEPSELIVE